MRQTAVEAHYATVPVSLAHDPSDLRSLTQVA